MSSLIATKVKTNMHFVSIKLSSLSALSYLTTVQYCTTYTTIITTIATLFLFLSALQSFCEPHLYVTLVTRLLDILLTVIFCKYYTHSLDLHNGELQTATSHMAD